MPSSKNVFTILGIDPGIALSGWGIVQFWKAKDGTSNLRCQKYGVIRTSPELNSGERIKKIYDYLLGLTCRFRPGVIAVERIFFFKNAKTVIPIGKVQGIVELLAAQKKIPLYEFSPLQVKMAVVGYGRAQKIQIQKMLQIFFDLKEIPKPDDAADALAIAICCAKYLRKI